MRLVSAVWVLLATELFVGVEAFSSGVVFCRNHHLVTASAPWIIQKNEVSFSRLAMASSDDDYDDWFSDYDPSIYENRQQDDEYGGGWEGSNVRNNRGGRRSNYNDGFDQRLGHDYTRDISRDNSNVNEDEVNNLLAERLRARKVGDFDTADDIRDLLLKEHSVAVFDKDRTWRTGISPSFRQPRPRQGRKPRRNKQTFGPHGHDYTLCEDAGPIISDFTEAEIHEAIAERLQAKLNRKFDVADKIQYGLVEAGVYIHDGLKQWRADGVPFGDFNSNGGRNPGRTQNSRSDRNRPYQQSQHSKETDDVEIIKDLIQERTFCKQERNFQEADAIRDELKQDYNVFVDDRLREWSVGGDFGDGANVERNMSESMRNRKYNKSPASQELPSHVDQEYIEEKVEQRAQAKRDYDYDTADAIRDELLQDYNVVIHDKLKLWSVGGDFGGGAKRLKKQPNEYIRRGGGDLSGDEFATISQLVAERAQCKTAKNFDRADEIRDVLREEYNVIVDDRSREWHVDTDIYVETDTGDLTVDQIENINDMLKERYEYKKLQNYDAADAIRDELRETYNVLVDDRTKEWKVATSSSREEDDLFPKDMASGEEDDLFTENVASRQDNVFAKELEAAAAMATAPSKTNDENAMMNAELDAVFDSIWMEPPIDDDAEIDDSNKEEEKEDPSREDNLFAKELEAAAALATKPSKTNDNAMMDAELDDVFDSMWMEPIDDDEIDDSGKDEEEEVPSADSSGVDDEVTQQDLASLTVVQLKEKLRESGMPVSGKKAELINRLLGV